MTALAVFSQTFMFCQQLWHQDATVSSSEISLWWLCCSGFFGQWTLFKCKSKVNVPFMVSCKWGVLLLRCCSSPKVPSERKAKWLSTGIIGYIYIYVPGEVRQTESRTCLMNSPDLWSKWHVEQIVTARLAVVCPRALWMMRVHPPRGLDSHMPFSLPPTPPCTHSIPTSPPQCPITACSH